MPIELKDWGIVFLHIFQFDIQLFHHSSVLFDGQVQVFFHPYRLQLVPWHGNVARRFWTAIRRLRKAASFVCIKVVFWKFYKWALWGRENYRKFLKLSCQEKVGEICSFCCEWTIERCPKLKFLTISAFRNTTTSPTRKPQKKGVIQMTSSQGSKQKNIMEVAGWFYPTQALLYLQISILSNQSLWWIIFNILKCWKLKGKREQKKRQRKVEKQKINHMSIILGLNCAKM